MKALALLTLWPGVLAAQELSLPAGAERVVSREAADALALATGPFADGAVPLVELPGVRRTEVWRIDTPDAAIAPVMADLRAQIEAQGLTVQLECADRACGGFDFRYAVPVEPPPEMMVDLGAFRYLSARDGGRGVAILGSRTPSALLLQIDRIAEAAPPPAQADAAPVAERGDVAGPLSTVGHAVLAGVDFGSGAVALPEGEIASLAELADWLARTPDVAVAIVGHTDADGSLEGNIAISRRRAQAVVDRLVADHGVPAGQLTAAGMGYLAPVASNLTPDGRAANRRVEAVITGRRSAGR